MSTGILKFNSDSKLKKRDYSKKGCRECKRRKIKCNEEKPACWQCRRLMKECSYPEAGERVLRISKKQIGSDSLSPATLKVPITLQNNENIAQSEVKEQSANIPYQQQHIWHHQPKPPQIPRLNNIQLYPPRLTPPSIMNLLNDTNASATGTHIHKDKSTELESSSSPSSSALYNTSHFPNVSSNQTISGNSTPSSTLRPADNNIISTLNTDRYHDYNQEDFDLLATDLNHIVSNMFDSNFDNKLQGNDITLNNILGTNLNNYDDKNNSYGNFQIDESALGIIENGAIPRNILSNFIKVSNDKEKEYIESFYNDFASVILPFNSFDEVSGCSFNPARDILLFCASRESCLLAAIFASGATILFKKSGLPEDEEASFSYLSKCLKLLKPKSQNNVDKDKNNSTSNIEAVLLTILLLTCANASSSKHEWRPHLKGAKDLLLKHTSKDGRCSQLTNSKILIFCKFWFSSIEVLAGLSSTFGGTLKDELEINLLISTGNSNEIHVLKELGIVKEDGFNLICGYHNSCVPHLRDLIKILNKIRSAGTKFEPSDSVEYIRLLSEFYQQTEIQIIEKNCVLKSSEFRDTIIPQKLLFDNIIVDKEKYFFSWMDASHQAYAIASLITILTKCFKLSHDSPQIQNLVERFISLMKCLGESRETVIGNSMMMIQWPLLVIGMNCTKEQHKLFITKLFNLSRDIGCCSAEISLRRINKVWKHHSNTNEEDTDIGDDANIDIVTY